MILTEQDLLEWALTLNDELKRQYQDARLASAAVRSIDTRLDRIEQSVALVLAHLRAERADAGDARVSHPRGPQPNVQRDAAVLDALEHGSLSAANIARVVFGSARVTRGQVKCMWQVLDRLVRHGSVIKLEDGCYDLPREEAVPIPPVEATAVQELQEAPA